MTFFRKKYYREVPCKACEGKGKIEKSMFEGEIGNSKLMEQSIIICPACSGKGTKTVLERIE